MPKITRAMQKIFAQNGTEQLAAFGSMKTNTPIYTDDIEALQTPAYEQGWEKAIVADEAPFLEEMNAVQYGFSKQIAYLLSTGIAEWDENTVYYANTSFCQVNGVLFQSLTDENIGNNPLTTEGTYWKRINIADTDLSNLTAKGENHFANKNLTNLTEEGEKHFLNKTQLTNCILEAPNGVATYSGTTITLKQGLKFLVPNGRNADGSLKNIEYVLSADTSYNAAVESRTTYTRNIIIFPGSNNMVVSSLSDNIPLYYQETQPSKFFEGFAYWYNTAENKVYFSNGNSVFTESLAIIIGSYTINSSTITALRTDKAVNLLKYSDLSWLTSLSLPSNKKVTLSIPGSDVSFRAVDDGYVQFHNEPDPEVISGVYNQSSGLAFYTTAPFYEGFVPVKKGDNVSVFYTKLQNPLLTFIYATGAQE